MYRGSPLRSTLNTSYIRFGHGKVCTEAVHSVALWTWTTLGLGMCKVCTEAVHCVALWTRVTLGLGMCKVCTEAVHCVSNHLQAFWRWRPLQASFKPPWSPPSALKSSSPLQAPFKWSPLQAAFQLPSNPLERLWSPLAWNLSTLRSLGI